MENVPAATARGSDTTFIENTALASLLPPSGLGLV